MQCPRNWPILVASTVPSADRCQCSATNFGSPGTLPVVGAVQSSLAGSRFGRTRPVSVAAPPSTPRMLSERAGLEAAQSSGLGARAADAAAATVPAGPARALARHGQSGPAHGKPSRAWARPAQSPPRGLRGPAGGLQEEKTRLPPAAAAAAGARPRPAPAAEVLASTWRRGGGVHYLCCRPPRPGGPGPAGWFTARGQGRALRVGVGLNVLSRGWGNPRWKQDMPAAAPASAWARSPAGTRAFECDADGECGWAALNGTGIPGTTRTNTASRRLVRRR